MEKITNLFDLFNQKTNSTLKVVYHDFKSEETLNSNQIISETDKVGGALESISATNVIIGCVLRPNTLLVPIILGILKTSSSFVFLNVQSPSAALKNLQKHIPVTVLLLEETFLKVLKEELCDCWISQKNCALIELSPLIVLQSLNCTNEQCPNSKLLHPNLRTCNSKLAYVIQTSGTTGDPKVVQVPHQCILPNIIDLRFRFDITSSDVILLCSPLTFDPSIIDIFLAVSSACTLVIVPDQVKSISRALAKAIIDIKVTILQCTPSLLQSLGNQFIKDKLLSKNSNLKVLAFGGEICPSVSKLQRWKSKENKTRIFNLYGLTEISCWASCFEISMSDISLPSSVPLGEPLLDTTIEIKNREVYIGSKKRWCIINNEIWPNQDILIMRPTGDMVSQTSDGQIYFEGRKDDVIKYKGQKISFPKINNLLEDMSEITSHYICFDSHSSKLLIFVVKNTEISFKEDIRHNLMKELRNHISNLPFIEIIAVPYIPLTTNGKTDYRILLELARKKWERLKASKLPSNNSYQEIINDLWKDYTHQHTIDESDNFILKGGDSFSALQLASDIEWKLQIMIPELVEKLLNDSFKEVIELIKTYMTDSIKINTDHELDHNFVQEKLSPDPPSPKRVCLTNFKCYEMSSRRGYSCVCTRSCGHAYNKKLFGDVQQGQRPFLKMICKFDLKKCIDASPCVSYFFQSGQMLVFIGSHSGLFCCINVNTQAYEWIISLPNRIESSSCLSPCGNYVYVGCYDYHVYSLDVKDGTIHWKFKTEAEVKSSPIVSSQNILFVGSHDKHLYAIQAQTGKLLWRKLISCGSLFSSPAVCEELSIVAVATLDGILAVLRMETGIIVWTYKHNKPLFSSPLFTSKALFIGSTNNEFLQLDLTGTLVSKLETGGPVFSSACLNSSLETEHIIFGCHDSSVYCMNVNGECVWKFGCDSPVYSTPFAFQWCEQRYVVIASTNGMLYVMQEMNGKMVHFYKCPGEVFSSPVVLNGILIIGCRDNNVYCFNLCNLL